MQMLKHNTRRMFVTTNDRKPPMAIDISRSESRRNGSRPLKTFVSYAPLMDEPRKVMFDIRIRYVGKNSDPSFSDRPDLFKRSVLPITCNNDGFLIVSARESQILLRSGREMRFTNFMNETLSIKSSIVTIVDPKQKKAHLISDVHSLKDGSFILLDCEGRTLGHLYPGDVNPVVFHSNLLDRFPNIGKAIVRVEMKLIQ